MPVISVCVVFVANVEVESSHIYTRNDGLKESALEEQWISSNVMKVPCEECSEGGTHGHLIFILLQLYILHSLYLLLHVRIYSLFINSEILRISLYILRILLVGYLDLEFGRIQEHTDLEAEVLGEVLYSMVSGALVD